MFIVSTLLRVCVCIRYMRAGVSVCIASVSFSYFVILYNIDRATSSPRCMDTGFEELRQIYAITSGCAYVCIICICTSIVKRTAQDAPERKDNI